MGKYLLAHRLRWWCMGYCRKGLLVQAHEKVKSGTLVEHPILMIMSKRALVTLGTAALALIAVLRVEAAARVHLYVSLEDSGEVVIVDPETAQVVRRIDVGKRPRGIKVSPNGKELYVALTGSPSAG